MFRPDVDLDAVEVVADRRLDVRLARLHVDQNGEAALVPGVGRDLREKVRIPAGVSDQCLESTNTDWR